MRRVPQPMQFELVGPRERLPAVSTQVGLSVEGAGVTPSRAVHIKRLVAPWTRVHPGDGIGVTDGVGSQDVDLIEALVAEPTHVVLASLVHLAVARERRVVDKPTIAHLTHTHV